MDNQATVLEPVSSAPEYSRAEQAFVSAVRRFPVFGGNSDAGRLAMALRGSAWTLLGYGGSQALRMASMVILARHFLGPQAFGLLALVSVFISGLASLSDLGIGTDVIRDPRGDDPTFVNTAFLIAVGRGLLLTIIASVLAYPFAIFYHQPAIFAMVLVSATSVLFQSMVSGSYYTLTRHVRLKGITLLRVGAEATGLLVSVLWAVASPTAWALVVGRVAAEAFFTIGTHFMREQRVSLKWDRVAAKSILLFGAGMFGSSLFNFLSGEAERLVIPKFVDLTLLGCFSLALSITAAATGGPQRLLAQVFYPMLSTSVRTDLGRAASQFRKVRFILVAACSCLSVVCIIGGKWIVAVLLGPKFVMAGWILQLVGFRAALDLYIFPTGQVLFAFGAPKFAALGGFAKLAFVAVGLTVAFGKFDFRTAVWVLAIAPIFGQIPYFVWIQRNFKVAFWSEMGALFLLVGISALAAVIKLSIG